MADREIIETLKKYVVLLKTEGVSVRRAFLFGSFANDTAKENSDIDVLIVSDNIDESNDLAIGKVWSLTRKVSTRIEPYLIGWDTFNSNDDSPLIHVIKSKGIRIV